jgi:AraC-like DNA-binding protein
LGKGFSRQLVSGALRGPHVRLGGYSGHQLQAHEPRLLQRIDLNAWRRPPGWSAPQCANSAIETSGCCREVRLLRFASLAAKEFSDVSGHFTTFQAPDPYGINRLLWSSLPPSEKLLLRERDVCTRVYAALDWRGFEADPVSYQCEFAMAHAGAMCLSRIADGRATVMTMQPPGLDAYCISVMERGASRLTPAGSARERGAGPGTSMIYHGEPGTQFASSDTSVRYNLWINGGLVREKLSELLEGRPVGSLQFEPLFDDRRGAGASIRRMLGFLFTELAHSDCLLSNGIALQGFQVWLVQSLLLGLRHSHSGQLAREEACAAPRNVRRAEELMRARARDPLTAADLALAAGCSVRALQAAFRRFRGTTPMSALRNVRLDLAREEIKRGESAVSVTQIAAEFGFSNPSRFTQLYRQSFGVSPAEALRRRRDD